MLENILTSGKGTKKVDPKKAGTYRWEKRRTIYTPMELAGAKLRRRLEKYREISKIDSSLPNITDTDINRVLAKPQPESANPVDRVGGLIWSIDQLLTLNMRVLAGAIYYWITSPADRRAKDPETRVRKFLFNDLRGEKLYGIISIAFTGTPLATIKEEFRNRSGNYISYVRNQADLIRYIQLISQTVIN
jgi:hypothetical protein